MDHMTALKVFRSVVEFGSFAEASRQMNMSPAAISKNVGELEAHLGVRLLNRTTRRMSRTEAGELFYSQVSRVLDDLNEAETLLGPMQQIPSGLLRVTAPMGVALIRITPKLPEFLKENPKLSVDLQLDSRRVNIVDEGFDLAIRASDGLVDSSLISKKLMNLEQVVCAAPSYLEAHGCPEAPQDLRDHECIKFSLSGHVDEWAFTCNEHTERVPIEGRYRVNSSFAVRDALTEGFGISMIPRIYVEDELKDGRLVPVLLNWKPNKTSVYAVYPSRRHLPNKVRVFIDFVREVLKED